MAGDDDSIDRRDRRSDAEPERATHHAGGIEDSGAHTAPSGNTDNRARRRQRWYTYPITNFYPGYSNSVGRLDRIAPISSVRMQRVLPRYHMSTEQTRTSRLGPPLIDYPVSVELSGEYGSPFSRMAEESRPFAAAGGARAEETGDEQDGVEGAAAAGGAPGGQSTRWRATDESEEIDDDSRGRIVDVEA